MKCMASRIRTWKNETGRTLESAIGACIQTTHDMDEAMLKVAQDREAVDVLKRELGATLEPS